MTKKIRLAILAHRHAQIAVKLIPVQLDPTALKADPRSDQDQTQQQHTEHDEAGNRGIQSFAGG